MSSHVMLLASCGRDGARGGGSSTSSSTVRVYAPESASASLRASRAIGAEAGEALCVRWSPTNGALCVGTKTGGCALMKPDLETLGRVPEEAVGSGEVRAVDFSAGSRYLAAGGTSGTGAAGEEEACVWDLKRKRKHRVFM